MVAEMSVVFLGTASAYPTPKRGVSCVAFRYGGFTWIFDCGEGSQIQLMRSDIKPGKITKIFISHLHGDHDWKVDHCGGPLLHPNEIQPELIEQDENGIWNLHNDCLEVQAVWLKHRVPSYGFVIKEKDIPGNLDKGKLKEMGIPPGPWCGKLKAGETVELPSGEQIKPEDILTPPQPGRKVIILGDTSNSSEVLKIGKDAHLLVHEATVENSLREKAIENGHSVPEMAAMLAKDLNVKQLVLTHFSQRYKPLSCEVKKNEESVVTILKEAEEVFGNNVLCAEDFTTVAVHIQH